MYNETTQKREAAPKKPPNYDCTTIAKLSKKRNCICIVLFSGFNDTLRYLRRNGLVMVKFHGKTCAALRHGAERRDVTEHLGERNFGIHDFVHHAFADVLHFSPL